MRVWLLNHCLAVKITSLDELWKSCSSVPLVLSLTDSVLGLSQVQICFCIIFDLFNILISKEKMCAVRFKGFPCFVPWEH